MPRALRHPTRLLPTAFLAALLVGTGLLMLPVARATGEAAPPLVALFTAASAVFITGLSTVDPATYWSPVGQGIILALIQVGGFGIMTFATVLGLMVSRRLALRTRLVAQAETRSLNLGEVRALLVRVLAMMVGFELAVAAVLTARFRAAYDDSLPTALWHGVFHAVSAFNNAGFSLYSDSFMGFVGDPWICGTVAVAVVLGGLGFPVMLELYREWRKPRYWSIHTRLTVWGSATLLVIGIGAVTAFEWSNPATLGPLNWWQSLVGGMFSGISPRTAGFNSIDYAAVRPETLAFTNVLMFIGGGSAGTSGGIKVTTFFLLAFVIWAEVRGEDDVNVGARRVPTPTVRQAVTVALLGVGTVAAGTLALLLLTDLPFDRVLFEATAAFSTAGLSTGITGSLPAAGQLTLVALMFIGRVGTITVASAIALRHRKLRYRRPEEQPIIG
ncbi:TrkH family potassium uptake protein [Dactylosporangium aurantiacum]|uniref:TrkH family potassium uptake protein n=1 Tax=Dactylosporangium aurantiacum TaxID=35754 RepID=A0A9Q9MQS1_9ACTN|nr:potassium transporter TrkG [Dactylosporangium aurantiacum]MDG6109872.1 potassium transporter TrkG [Dactylosporangium aurantiacum]UWZ57852.1 TrkH family potassium uptake protein [Dactylosporangium aurantiacum]